MACPAAEGLQEGVLQALADLSCTIIAAGGCREAAEGSWVSECSDLLLSTWVDLLHDDHLLSRSDWFRGWIFGSSLFCFHSFVGLGSRTLRLKEALKLETFIFFPFFPKNLFRLSSFLPKNTFFSFIKPLDSPFFLNLWIGAVYCFVCGFGGLMLLLTGFGALMILRLGCGRSLRVVRHGFRGPSVPLPRPHLSRVTGFCVGAQPCIDARQSFWVFLLGAVSSYAELFPVIFLFRTFPVVVNQFLRTLLVPQPGPPN
jgi:hypothetical protein